MGLRTGTSRLGRGGLSLGRFTSVAGVMIYVDSVAGSDANSGLSEAAAKQTLAAAQTLAGTQTQAVTVNLKRGSTWREQFNIPKNDVTITSYGSGAIPVIDGADVVAVTWTQPDAATYPDVWQVSWTRASATTSGSESLGYWENGARTARYATNATTDLQTNGGWFCSNLFATPTGTTPTVTVSIKSTTNPNSDGVLREITKRHYGISGSNTSLGATRTGEVVTGPIEIKRCVAHSNALALSGGSRGNQLLLRDGTIHHSVVEGELLEDIVATEYSPQIAPSVLVMFRPSGAGYNPIVRRLGALMPGGASRVSLTGSSAFYSHSSVSLAVTSATLEGSFARGIDFATASAQLFTATNNYVEDPHNFAIADGPVLSAVRRLMVRDTAATPRAGGNMAFSRLGTTSTFTAEDVASYTMKNRCIANTAGGTAPVITRSAFVNTTNGDGWTNGGPAITYTIFYVNGFPMNTTTVGSGYAGNYNVFYGMNANPFIRWDNNLYAGNFSAYVAASGQDTHSVYLKLADQTSGSANAFWLGISSGANNGPADGDFRINPNARVYDKDNTARIGVFGDGTTAITAAGPQTHYNFNTRSVVAGPPSRYPVLPATVAEMRTYVDNPSGWNFYP